MSQRHKASAARPEEDEARPAAVGKSLTDLTLIWNLERSTYSLIFLP